jgi:hypothetical protein
MPKMTVTTNDGRFVADFEIGDVDPVDYQPEIDEVLREAFELGGPDRTGSSATTSDPGSPRPQRVREETDLAWVSGAGRG